VQLEKEAINVQYSNLPMQNFYTDRLQDPTNNQTSEFFINEPRQWEAISSVFFRRTWIKNASLISTRNLISAPKKIAE